MKVVHEITWDSSLPSYPEAIRAAAHEAAEGEEVIFIPEDDSKFAYSFWVAKNSLKAVDVRMAVGRSHGTVSSVWALAKRDMREGRLVIVHDLQMKNFDKVVSIGKSFLPYADLYRLHDNIESLLLEARAELNELAKNLKVSSAKFRSTTRYGFSCGAKFRNPLAANLIPKYAQLTYEEYVRVLEQNAVHFGMLDYLFENRVSFAEARDKCFTDLKFVCDKSLKYYEDRARLEKQKAELDSLASSFSQFA
jgi:hypothetical protein